MIMVKKIHFVYSMSQDDIQRITAHIGSILPPRKITTTQPEALPLPINLLEMGDPRSNPSPINHESARPLMPAKGMSSGGFRKVSIKKEYILF